MLFPRLIFCAAFILSVHLSDSYAINFDSMSEAEQQKLMGGWKPIEAKNGALSWKLFGKTKSIEHKQTYPDGSYAFTVTPDFDASLKAFKDKKVKLMGYMFPLDASDKQKDFLFGPFPVSCPYHYHTPPEMVVEVLSKDAIAFSYDPITIEGTLSLDFNEEQGVFYYLKDAKLVK
jgi:hypothetical protein